MNQIDLPICNSMRCIEQKQINAELEVTTICRSFELYFVPITLMMLIIILATVTQLHLGQPVLVAHDSIDNSQDNHQYPL